MKRTLSTVILGLLTVLALNGCATNGPNIDYSKLDQNEKKLLSIQDETTSQIEQLSAELQKTTPDYDKIRFLAIETSKFITEKIKQVEDLADSVKNNAVVEDTRKVLSSANMLINKVKELASNLQVLKRDISQRSDDAKAELQTQIDETQKLLDGYESRLQGVKDKFNELRELLVNPPKEETPATTSTEQPQKSEATI